jgi:NADH-quinone oxidoreductase subunit F
VAEEVELEIDSYYGMPSCQEHCPLGQPGRDYLALIAAGQLEDAFSLVYRENPLPASCGRICHKCEPFCNRGRLDAPVRVATLKSFVADRYYSTHPVPARRGEPARKEHVAIVGSGPSGLTAARRLVLLGYPVTVFEAMPVAGGQLAIGIPQHRLPREVVQREVDEIAALGVDLRLSSPVADVDGLFADGYAAVLVATGSHRSKLHPAVGSNEPNVLLNTEFLRETKLGRPVGLGRQVLVVGGGNVAMDCARTARRMGKPGITVACVESRDCMPAHSREVEAALAEGISLEPGTAILRVIRGVDDKIVGAEAARVVSLEMGSGGSPTVQHDQGSIFTIPCDTIVLAIGQTPDARLVSRCEGAIIDRRGAIEVLSGGSATGCLGLFAAGDAVTIVGSVPEAIAAGESAAWEIHRFISGEATSSERPSLPPAPFDLSKAREVIVAGLASPAPRLPLHELPADARIAEWADREVDRGMTLAEAVAEAKRCLACGIQV